MTAPRLNSGVFSSASDEWATPADLFAALDRQFRFAVDVCATADNAKCGEYFSPSTDGLTQPWPYWPRGGCFMNPPYSQIGAWMQKAHSAALAGSCVVCLVPARTDTRWFWRYASPADVRFLPGRLKFGEGKNSAPFPSAVVVMWPRLPLELRRAWFWNWKLEKEQ